jgi:hypothetical protein
MKFKALIALLGCFAVLAQPILLVADSPTWKKCLYTEHSPDKVVSILCRLSRPGLDSYGGSGDGAALALK